MRICLLALVLPAALHAAPGGTIAFESSADLGPLFNFGLVALCVTGLAVLAYKFYNRRRPQSGAAGPQRQQERRLRFREEATARGFRQTETRLLIQVAHRIAPKTPDNLLESDTGREYLLKDLEKRVRRRQREIDLIRRIQAKLEKMRTQDLQPRESIRVEADMRVWLARKMQGTAAQEGDGEDVFVNIEPVSGHLIDISEGGAATRGDLQVERGDLVEFWSGDTDILLSPITAAVVDARYEPGEEAVLHLHFMDPPLAELRSAIYALQRRSEERSAARSH